MNYPIHELFHAFQGEGCHMGRNAFFVRLFGCPLHCSFCDSAGTWHPTYVPKNIERLSAFEILGRIPHTSCFVVITGGEPCVHDLTELLSEIQGSDLPVHLETSGAFPILKGFDWITLSPKRAKLPLPENLLLADEFKLIIEKPEDIDFYQNLLSVVQSVQKPIWLHPEWSQRENSEVLTAISKTVKTSVLPYRAGYQIHKLYRVDHLDLRVRPPVPLGGDFRKGF